MAAQQRPPVFELHIRPMFRLLEREHMTTLLTPGIDLWDLDAVWAKRNLILGRLRAEGLQTMPGAQVGGPWPAEWISLFERWAATGSDAEPGLGSTPSRAVSATTHCISNPRSPASRRTPRQ